MIDLKLIYTTNYESVTRAVSGRGAGGFIGAVVGALLVDKFNDRLELFMALFTTVAGLCVAVVTNLPSIDHVWLLYCLIGGSSNVVNMGTYICDLITLSIVRFSVTSYFAKHVNSSNCCSFFPH